MTDTDRRPERESSSNLIRQRSRKTLEKLFKLDPNGQESEQRRTSREAYEKVVHMVNLGRDTPGGASIEESIAAEEIKAYFSSTSIVAQSAETESGLSFQNIEWSVQRKISVGGMWQFQPLTLLKGITGKVLKGEITAIVGNPGAGKSVLLGSLAGRIRNFRGRVCIDGWQVTSSFMRRHAAFSKGNHQLISVLTAREALAFAAEMRMPSSMSSADKLERVDEIMEHLDLMEIADSVIGGRGYSTAVSAGQRRRLSIATDIIDRPALIFLNDPALGLDCHDTLELVVRLRELAVHKGSTVILTLQKPSHRVAGNFHQLLILAQGRLLFSGKPETISAHLMTMFREVPRAEDDIEYFLDMIKDYEESEAGLEALVAFQNVVIAEHTKLLEQNIGDSDPPATNIASSGQPYDAKRQSIRTPRVDEQDLLADLAVVNSVDPNSNRAMLLEGDTPGRRLSCSILMGEQKGKNENFEPASNRRSSWSSCTARDAWLASEVRVAMPSTVPQAKAAVQSFQDPKNLIPSTPTLEHMVETVASPFDTNFSTAASLMALHFQDREKHFVPFNSPSFKGETPQRFTQEIVLSQDNVFSPCHPAIEIARRHFVADTCITPGTPARKAHTLRDSSRSSFSRYSTSSAKFNPALASTLKKMQGDTASSHFTRLSASLPVAKSSKLTPGRARWGSATSSSTYDYEEEEEEFTSTNSRPREILLLLIRNFCMLTRNSSRLLIRVAVLGSLSFLITSSSPSPSRTVVGADAIVSCILSLLAVTFFAPSLTWMITEVIEEHSIFVVDFLDRTYRCSSFVLAHLITSLPYLLISSFGITIIAWFFLQLDGGVQGFLAFWTTIILCLFTSKSFAMLLTLLSSSRASANFTFFTCTSIFLLFSGFFIQLDKIPKFWIILHYISPIKFAFEALLKIQFQSHSSSTCYTQSSPHPLFSHLGLQASSPSPCAATGGSVLANLAINHHKSVAFNMTYLLLWGVAYKFLYYLALLHVGNAHRKQSIAPKIWYMPGTSSAAPSGHSIHNLHVASIKILFRQDSDHAL